MSRLFGPIFQMAYVVPDLGPFLDHMTRVVGVGPFFLFPVPLPFIWMKRHDVKSDATDILSHAALAFSGETMVEVIVPSSQMAPLWEPMFANARLEKRSRCLIPQCGGTIDHHAWREGLWDRFYTAAPGRLRQSVERYSGVKRA